MVQESMSYMREPWLKKEDRKWLQSPQEQDVANLHMNQIMCPNEKAWDNNKILSLFPPYVANHILAVPLFVDIEEDHLVWADDIHGNYNVKFGYKMLLQTQFEGVITQGNKGWRWLWKIQAPQKTKDLLWRICKGCLPTRLRLKVRHVQCPLICPLCDLKEEDDWHFLYGCENSKRAWNAAGLDHFFCHMYSNQGVYIGNVL
jgi:hypothetical protein